jgi:hypothetical protein
VVKGGSPSHSWIGSPPFLKHPLVCPDYLLMLTTNTSEFVIKALGDCQRRERVISRAMPVPPVPNKLSSVKVQTRFTRRGLRKFQG